ncbi:MAG: NAD(P)-dependent glycerol-3-phosphate dehydrogenase [Lentisphaerae bacterium]|nr:NAD(P)-dependent glycerol-3-phosphate dehydrogenase [Lentisphaerota bacterium]
MTKHAAVIGDGGWGTALAMILNENGYSVTVWGPFPDYIDNIRKTRENDRFLPNVKLPEQIKWTSDKSEAVDKADIIVLAIPTKYYAAVVSSFAEQIGESPDIVSVAKGLDQESHLRMSEVAETLLHHPVAVLSGPSHAEEVARGIPTAVCVASADFVRTVRLQTAFSNRHFRVYTADDPPGVELGGALKNVIAIAVGVSDGLGFGDNTRAALITRGLAEMTRLGCSMGAKPETFAGLSGMGDLIVTCTSRLSRNRSIGERIGKGEALNVILGNMKMAAEGVWNCASARALAIQNKVEVPITNEVYAIVHMGKSPHDAVVSLLEREVKPENDNSASIQYLSE